MKKLLLTLTLALFAASCNDETDIIVVKEGPSITLNVSPMAYTLPDATGGGIFEISGSLTGFGLYEFDQTKQIFTNYNRHFTAAAEGGYSAASQSSAGWSKNAKTLYAYAPYSVTATSVTALEFTIPANITQKSDDPEAHILANNLLVSTAEVAAGAAAETLTFAPASALINFEVTNDTSGEISVSQIDYAANQAVFNTTGSYNFREQTCVASNPASALSVALSTPVTLAAGEKTYVYLPIVPSTIAKDTELTITVSTDRGAATIINVVNAAEGLVFEGGKAYTQKLSISDEFFVEVLPGGQNSYIVKPAEDGGETYFMMPITRVNEYWGGVVSNADNQIYDDTKWVAEIIWKDFDAENKTLVLTEGKNVGTGPLAKIGFTLYANAADQWGNALIGIKKADDSGNPVGDYLWSWHIWVSDVSTNNTSVINDGEVMDRHLGAKSAKKEEGVLAQGLLYQWGRKDPFIGTAKNWYADGETPTAATTNYTWPTPAKFIDTFTETITNSTSYEVVDYAVNHPTTFIMRSENSWAWANYTEYNSSTTGYWKAGYELWLSGKKTIYDPCPKGWILAKQASFGTGKADAKLNIDQNNSIGDWTWDDTYKGYTVNGIWFPAQKGLNGRTGNYGADPSTATAESVDDVTQNAFVVWTGQGSALNSSYWGSFRMACCRALYFTPSNMWHQLRGTSRANANPVRCIRYTAED